MYLMMFSQYHEQLSTGVWVCVQGILNPVFRGTQIAFGDRIFKSSLIFLEFGHSLAFTWTLVMPAWLMLASGRGFLRTWDLVEMVVLGGRSGRWRMTAVHHFL